MKSIRKTWMRVIFLSLFINLLSFSVAFGQQKHEFRAAWIQCVNGQFVGMSTQTMQQTLIYQLDELKKTGVNTIIFQVRPECDALYPSDIEPWSRFLTGQQGKSPNPYWDPLQWMIVQCHSRGMDLHAWINPYRAKTKATTMLSTSHIAIRHPERVFEYDDLLILQPALQENRDYICSVVADIVSRYDVDGVHFDDYFYPYPVAGKTIPDDNYFLQNPEGFTDKGDWRRHQVSLFVRQLYETVKDIKPWVKVGVSPFGIYRNKKNDPNGSATNGLQNYDDLYADILLWVNEGWVDYNVPQLYWEIGNRAADYNELIHWWNEHASERPLFIGEDIERTAKFSQQQQKMQLYNECENVGGTVLWYAKAAVDDTGGYATQLRTNYWRYPALQPYMPFITKKAPKKVRKDMVVWVTDDEPVLFWTPPRSSDWEREATQYVVYRFERGEKVNTDDPSKIVAITTDTFYKLPIEDLANRCVYAVTALNRLQNESKPVKVKLKL